MKKVRFVLVAIIASVLVLCLTGCGPLLGGKSKKRGPSKPLSFNVSGATAVASTEKSSDNRSAFRAADSANEKVLKILEDGTVESIINFPSDIDSGTLEYFIVDELAVSPAPDAEETASSSIKDTDPHPMAVFSAYIQTERIPIF